VDTSHNGCVCGACEGVGSRMWWDYCVSVLFGVDEKDGHAGHGVLGRDELMRAAEEEHA
jgi:hypothetical protein